MQDPKRLIVSENDELALALAGARRQVPGERRLAALAERLVQAGVAMPADSGLLVTPPTPTVPAAAPAAIGAWRLVVGLTMVAVAGLATLIGVRHMASVPPAAPRASSSPVPAPAEITERPVLMPSARALRTLALGGVETPPAERIAAPPNLVAPKGAESAARVGLPAAPPAPRRTSSTSVVTLAERTHSRKAKGSASTVSASARPTGPTTYETPRESEPPLSEVELLKQARNALKSDPLQAYALTERCRALYAQGAFVQERDFMALTALARIGREREARGLATSFRERYPRSAYLPQLDRIFGVE